MTTMPCDKRHFVIMAAVAVYAVCALPTAARAAPMPLTNFAAIAIHCAPLVPLETLIAIARTESGIDPWALYDNTTGQSFRPSSLMEAITDAEQQIDRGDSVDLGLMQINSANLPALGLNVTDALDACHSLAGAAAVLRAAYGGENTHADQQVALLLALSRYNTGTPFKGIMNGYARAVLESVPPETLSSPTLAVESIEHPTDTNAPPAWNIWATAAYAQTHGSTWMIAPSPNTAAHSTEILNAQSISTLIFATPSAASQALSSTPPRRSP